MVNVDCSKCSEVFQIAQWHYDRNIEKSYKFFCSDFCKKVLLEDRFWEKVNKTNNINDCWNWTAGCRKKDGYGTLKYNKKFIDAHRLSWMVANNKFDLTSKDFICHKCDNKKCVNPNHLFLGNAKINAKDAYDKGRMKVPIGNIYKKGHKPTNAVLDYNDVMLIKEMIENGDSVIDIAELFKVSRYKITDIRRGRSYINVK